MDELVLNSTPIPLPATPFLVVITIAPLAARDPYNAAALGLFSTVMETISSGFMLLIPSPPCKPPFSLSGELQ